MSRYSEILKLKNINTKKGEVNFYRNVLYPEIPLNVEDIYVITEFGDKLSYLSFQFYKSVEYYWVIASANPQVLNFGSNFPPSGIQLRIPTNLNLIVEEYNKLNSFK